MADYPYRTSVDRDPDTTDRAVLRVLASGTWWKRRTVQNRVFGTDFAGAGWTATSLARLARKHLAVRSAAGWWRITDAGMLALELDDELRSA